MKNLLRGVEIVFGTTLRVPPVEREASLHYYDVRDCDDCTGEPSSVERNVFINHLGTIATTQPLPLDEDGCLLLSEDEQSIICNAL